MKTLKEIKLVPEKPFYNSVDIVVLDFPKGRDEAPRQRCKVSVEYAKVDVEALQKKNMDFSQAMDYYKEYLYQVVKVHIASDWECVEGMEETLVIIEEKVARFYDVSNEAL